MPQIFHHSTNTLSRVSIFGAVFALAAFLWLLAMLSRSAYWTRQTEVPPRRGGAAVAAPARVPRRAVRNAATRRLTVRLPCSSP